ncbi:MULTISPECIES: hypothetical protein [Paenibacillus]|uniref:hypothetical protein n=1 Tax=Paenibacillus TaxID=44249 RepID=UPI0003FA165C|nr:MULTISPECIES: hypothetical protein [Paenibacillus]KKC49012.1 hypothetical protein VE23_21065 [Paenibacillus sp. D9]SIR32796.1 hypothetical protein SAMN05880555_3490 [Paenibacillus sp. RU4X]SIR44013.1 hypothetical protein SAMN05880570_3491 [Paenibacillus sp. RU4T]
MTVPIPFVRKSQFIFILPKHAFHQMVWLDFAAGSATAWLMEEGHLAKVLIFAGSGFVPYVLKKSVNSSLSPLQPRLVRYHCSLWSKRAKSSPIWTRN